MIKLRNNVFAILISLFFSTGCSEKKELNQESFLGYLNSEKSGLTIIKKLNGIQYTLKCQTSEQQCLSFNKLNISSQVEFDKYMKEYLDKLNFILLIEDEKGESEKVRKIVFNKEVYGNILGYANNGINEDISLETENSKIPCGMVHLESANSVRPVLRMSISFGGIINPNEEITFVFNDNIFNNGPIKFNYSKNVFDQLPKLKIESI